MIRFVMMRIVRFGRKLGNASRNRMGIICSICARFRARKGKMLCQRVRVTIIIVKLGKILCVVMIIAIHGLRLGSVKLILLI